MMLAKSGRKVGFGRGFNEKNLRRMIQFAESFPDEQNVVSLIRQLSWTHFIALIPVKDPLQREFYAQMCRLEGWDVRTLRSKIDSMFCGSALGGRGLPGGRLFVSGLDFGVGVG